MDTPIRAARADREKGSGTSGVLVTFPKTALCIPMIITKNEKTGLYVVEDGSQLANDGFWKHNGRSLLFILLPLAYRGPAPACKECFLHFALFAFLLFKITCLLLSLFVFRPKATWGRSSVLAGFQNDTFGSLLVKNMNISARFSEFLVIFAAVNGKGVALSMTLIFF